MRHADLILEVLLIPDKAAPLGYGFDVRLKSLKTGSQISTIYTRGRPRPQVQHASDRWIAGDRGFERQAPPAPPPPGVYEIGRHVARDVLAALGISLEAARLR